MTPNNDWNEYKKSMGNNPDPNYMNGEEYDDSLDVNSAQSGYHNGGYVNDPEGYGMDASTQNQGYHGGGYGGAYEGAADTNFSMFEQSPVDDGTQGGGPWNGQGEKWGGASHQGPWNGQGEKWGGESHQGPWNGQGEKWGGRGQSQGSSQAQAPQQAQARPQSQNSQQSQGAQQQARQQAYSQQSQAGQQAYSQQSYNNHQSQGYNGSGYQNQGNPKRRIVNPALLQERNIVMAIVFSLITFGIYFIYWFYQVAKSILIMNYEDEGSTVIETILFFIIPFYNLYWFYTRGNKMSESAQEKWNYPFFGENGVIYLILCVVATPLVPIIIMQHTLNQFARRMG